METIGSQLESFQKREFHEQAKGHRSPLSKRKSESRVTKSVNYLSSRKRGFKDDTSHIQLRKKCTALQKAWRKLEKETHNAQYAASKLRRKLEKKQKKLFKERLLSEAKDLEIDFLREDINKVEQELKKIREDLDGSCRGRQETATNLNICAGNISPYRAGDSGHATPKVSDRAYKTEDLWNQGFKTTADDSFFWNGPKTVSSTKSGPTQRAFCDPNFPFYELFDHVGRKNLQSLESKTTQRTSRRTTEVEALVDSIPSESRLDTSSGDDRKPGRRLRTRKKVNYDLKAPEHWSGTEFFD
ncbi:hypothetical protein FLAG1_01239 [Fusarium langsethiae]|uniref:Uncharacterized protein n=1 Tax=Fusarium langsethiae TaxID=179993 RepID=A0A0M9F4H1_FUSLA|nr:hypothetical protein FLAG1_01239 [Fusarium langsethiae]GKT99072.1 unnamed protein product [Fusarium langsethiae]GKU20329.1 unnamed protein product [Fusarium langsethiae]